MKPKHLLIFALTVTQGLIVSIGCNEKKSKDEILRNVPSELRGALETMQSSPFLADGIDDPMFVSADEAGLAATSEVIGVLIEGRAIAYPIKRLHGSSNHVVNSKITTPVGYNVLYTVTYCDLSECIRVVGVDPENPTPASNSPDSLKLGIQGLLEGELALHWQGKGYKHEADIPGLINLPHERLTWLDWRAKHPNSTVYAGRSGK